MPSYTVQGGDTLSGIANKVGLGSNWQSLGYSGDPTKLQVGTVLNYGSPSGSSSPSSGGGYGSGGSGYTPPAGTSPNLPNGAPNVNSFFDPVLSRTNDINAGRTNLLSSLYGPNGEQQNLVKNFQNFVTNLPSYKDTYQNLLDNYNVPGIGSIKDTQGLIDNYKNQMFGIKQQLAGQPSDSTPYQGSTLNNDQRSGALNNTLAQLGNSLEPVSNLYQNAMDTVNNEVKYEEDNQNKQIASQQTGLDAFTSRAAAEITGYDANAKSELDSLLQRATSGAQMSQDQWAKMQDLAIQEKGFQNAKQVAQIQAGGQLGAASIGADASKYGAALSNPGIAVSRDANGNYTSSIPNYLKDTSSNGTASSLSSSPAIDALNNRLQKLGISNAK